MSWAGCGSPLRWFASRPCYTQARCCAGAHKSPGICRITLVAEDEERVGDVEQRLVDALANGSVSRSAATSRSP